MKASLTKSFFLVISFLKRFGVIIGYLLPAISLAKQFREIIGYRLSVHWQMGCRRTNHYSRQLTSPSNFVSWETVGVVALYYSCTPTWKEVVALACQSLVKKKSLGDISQHLLGFLFFRTPWKPYCLYLELYCQESFAWERGVSPIWGPKFCYLWLTLVGKLDFRLAI